MLKKISSQHKKQCTKNGAWMQSVSAGWRAKGFSTKQQICSEAREKSLAAVKWVAGKTAAAGVKAVFRGSRLAVGTAWARRQEHQRADGSANVSAGKLCSLILCDTAPSAACGVELQHKASTWMKEKADTKKNKNIFASQMWQFAALIWSMWSSTAFV